MRGSWDVEIAVHESKNLSKKYSLQNNDKRNNITHLPLYLQNYVWRGNWLIRGVAYGVHCSITGNVSSIFLKLS